MIHVIFNKIWTYGDKSAWIDSYVVNSSTIKFRIRDKFARERILCRGMWNIADRPMVVSKLGPKVDEEPPPLLSMPLWVKIKNIPNSMFSWSGLSFLTSVVGTPKRPHPETEICKEFDVAKVLVDVDLTKELPTNFDFKFSSGSKISVEYSYPWLPPICNECGKWGHLPNTCRRPLQQQIKHLGQTSRPRPASVENADRF